MNKKTPTNNLLILAITEAAILFTYCLCFLVYGLLHIYKAPLLIRDMFYSAQSIGKV